MGFRVQGLGFGVWGLGFRVWGFGFGVSGFGFRAWGSGYGGEGFVSTLLNRASKRDFMADYYRGH